MNEDQPVDFGTFDPCAEVERSERCLPHWFQAGVATFITFRTADSLPRQVIESWRREQEDWLRRRQFDESIATDHTKLDELTPPARRQFQRLRDRAWHGHLDDCHGQCVLRRPELAAIVGDSLRHFDGERYDLDSFVVMPNHVHLLVQFRRPTSLQIQTKSWLHYTAVRINRHLGRRGRFWQTEPFDHLVRSAEQFVYLHGYIAANPRRANLGSGEFLYWSSVARRCAT